MRPETKKVLLLDDYPDSVELLAIWLEAEGWAPVATRTVNDALAFLAQEQPTAVVMERYLRSGDALTVAKAARRNCRARPLLVSVSGTARVGDETAYEPTLFDHNLVKPVNLHALSEVLALAKAQRH